MNINVYIRRFNLQNPAQTSLFQMFIKVVIIFIPPSFSVICSSFFMFSPSHAKHTFYVFPITRYFILQFNNNVNQSEISAGS